MKLILATLGFLAAVPVTAQSIEVASGNWSEIPEIRTKSQPMLSPATAARVDEIAKQGKCSVPGVTRRYVDLTVPFVVEFMPDGGVQRIVLTKLGCPELESVLGGVLANWVASGRYVATGENQLGWYRGELKIALR
jgi:hypothetical protein